MNNPLPDTAADLSALSALAPSLASTFVTLAGDIALVIDADGVVRKVAAGEAALGASAAGWVGRPWVDTASGDTRLKLERLLSEVNQSGRSRRREVNHPSAAGQDIPVAWAAVRLGEHGPVLALGRDLRAVAAIQQRFVESQQELERDYWKQRRAESHYRLLFQVATDAVLVLDAQSLRIIEANRAAAVMFGEPLDRLPGLDAADAVDPHSWPALEQLLNTARVSGRAAELRVRAARGGAPIDISATPFRAEQSLLLLVRARPAPEAPGLLSEYLERAPDAVVVTDTSGRVLAANPAFQSLGGQPADRPVEGRRLGELLPEADSPLRAVIDEARRHGIATRTLPAAANSDTMPALEVSAMLLPEGDQERIGFTLRPIPAPAAAPPGLSVELADALQRLARQIGQQALPQLMREVTSLAERHLIQSAVAQHGPGHGEIAAALGVSLESLELRMRRLGLLPGADTVPTAVP